MAETTAIEMIIGHLKGRFPKDCPRCERHFITLQDFYLHTTPTRNPVSHDLEAGDLAPQSPLGAVAVSSCQCGEPIAFASEGWPIFH